MVNGELAVSVKPAGLPMLAVSVGVCRKSSHHARCMFGFESRSTFTARSILLVVSLLSVIIAAVAPVTHKTKIRIFELLKMLSS